jgi:hypothetical protein
MKITATVVLAALVLTFVGNVVADEPNARTTIAQTEDVNPKTTDTQPPATKPSIMPTVGEVDQPGLVHLHVGGSYSHASQRHVAVHGRTTSDLPLWREIDLSRRAVRASRDS